MKIIQRSFLSLEQKQSVFELWNLEYPDKLAYSKISELDIYLNALTDKKHYLLLNDENEIVAWAFTFIRDDDKWFAIILNSKIHRKGYGRLLLNELKKNESILNGWVIDQNGIRQNKKQYISPLEFYIKNGFEIILDTRIETDKISAVKIRWIRQLYE
ncbi:GNAT family N-acetyltransferase [Flavobacterium sp.]|uniref:GNAT family N-acetyltransferase n=1 Tax=Flavobacterium sp. TaxID=239 RepID=UPI002C3D5EC3|nr:GNAT family N-acetyltransferase [Flavobacterium sp.]HSD06617.1 GNAT family N-acetyltransferase [Flavobacterium sp.]